MAKYKLKKKSKVGTKWIYKVEVTQDVVFKHKDELTSNQIDNYIDTVVLPENERIKMERILKLKEELNGLQLL